MSNASDRSTNRLIGQWYDANGNAGFNGTSYDVENRLTARTMTETSQNETYQYDPSGQRVARHYYYNGNGLQPDDVEIFTYDLAGRRILTSTCTVLNAGSNTCTLGKNYQRQTNQQEIYFAGRLVSSGGAAMFRDRLGSVRGSSTLGWPVNYLPYGEERQNPPTQDGQMKFATYYRDSTLDSQDYANQRYYNSWMGRFNTADPSANGAATDPASWNRYTYSGSDPVNHVDPGGTDYFDPNDCVTWVSSETVYDGPPCGYNQWGSVFVNMSGIAGCGGIGPSQFNPGIGMACLALLQAAAPQQAAPQVSCEDTETAYLISYLDRYKPTSPLIAYAQTIVDDSDLAGVDDRFIIALAGQESQYGTNLTRGPFNAWNNLAHTAHHNPYSSWNTAIRGVVSLITGGLYFGSGRNTTDSIYGTYNNSNLKTNPDFPKQLASLNSIYLGQLGGGLLSNRIEVDFSRCTAGK